MLEIDCTELPRNLCRNIFEEIENELENHIQDIKLLPQSQIINVHKDSTYLHGQLIQVVYSSLVQQMMDSDEYTREELTNIKQNGIKVRKI